MWISEGAEVEGDDDDEDDADDLDNEINYGQGNSSKAGMLWEEDADLSSSSGHDSHIPNPHLVNGQPVMYFADSEFLYLGEIASVPAKMWELVNSQLFKHAQTQLLKLDRKSVV